MTQTGDRVAIPCPSCGDGSDTIHEVLKPGGQATVRCTDCDHTHKAELPDSREIEQRIVVSQDGDSFSTRMDVDPEEDVAVGDEFIVDTPEALMQVRVTGLEVAPEQRTEEATFEEIQTVWTRAVDNVRVRITLHPKDGNRDETRSLTVHVPGDYEFVVGETEDIGDQEFTVEGLVVREDAPEYRHGKLDHAGDMAYAKDLTRVYARDETTTAWSAW